jgi:hypothetical protein
MGAITIQTRLENYFKINVQSTITEYNESNSARKWDKHVSLRSRKWPGYEIQCSYFKKSFVTEFESLVRCDHSYETQYARPSSCHSCPLERTKRIWVSVNNEYRKRPVFVSFRRSRRFWNRKKE